MSSVSNHEGGVQKPASFIRNLAVLVRHWKRFLWLLIPAILLAILLAVALQGPVRKIILVPAAYVVWLGGLLLKSTPDILLWGWLVLMAIILAFRSLQTGRERAKHKAEPGFYRYRRERLAFWLLQIQLAESEYARLRLVDFLRKLTIGVLLYRERLLPDQLEENLLSGDLQIPAEIALLVKEKVRPEASRPRHLWMRARSAVARALRWATLKKEKSASFEQELLHLVEYLEKQLDIRPEETANGSLTGHGAQRGAPAFDEKD